MDRNSGAEGEGLPNFQMSPPRRPRERIEGAPVSVMMLRRKGVKLTKAEREAGTPLVGEMTISRFRKNDASTITLEAVLYKSGPSALRYQIGACLFDPIVISMDERGTVYRGYELEHVDGKLTEYVQVWLVKPLP